MNRGLISIASVIALCLLSAGCSQKTIESATQDAQKNIKVVDQQAQEAEKRARPELNKLGLGARVTTALQANANLPHTIRVDAGANGVRLRGNVKTHEQKALAGRIAKDTVPQGNTVTNELEVHGG